MQNDRDINEQISEISEAHDAVIHGHFNLLTNSICIKPRKSRARHRACYK